jgi:polyisoprenoid-binding protein YceI
MTKVFMMKTLIALSILTLSFSSFANKVTFNVTLSPAGSFQAVSNKAKGNIIKQGDAFTADKITVSIESFKTGIDLRDEHTWKHMNSAKFPKAVLSDVKGQGGKATAQLEVNGVKKPITIAYAVAGENVNAKFAVKASEFGMSKAEYLGVGVNDVINVEASLPFKSK